MAVTFELWSIASGNVVGYFNTEAAALAAVRDAFDHHGQEYVDGLALGREDSRGRSHAIAQGGELLKLALHAATKPVDPRTPRPARERSRGTGATPTLR